MTALTNVEIGSVVYNLVDNIPTGISGTLPYLVNLGVYTAENYTGNDISVDSIGDVYQPAVINLTISQVLGQMEAQGLGTKSVKIGELSITKGMQEGTSKSFQSLAFNQLNDLGKSMSYYQTYN